MSLFNNAIIGASSQGGYQISRSVRTRASATAYFNRTFTTPTLGTKWTWSGWVKRGTLGSSQTLMAGGSSSNDFSYLGFLAGNTFTVQQFDAGVQTLAWTSTGVFRDTSAWYHVIIQYDSTQATGTNRLSVWVNNTLQAGTYSAGPITQNTLSRINTATTHYINRYFSAANYFDGYLAEANFIDGQALTPSSFGETNAITGVWQPKKYAGTYGTNGFYLNFSDNSAATAAAIGADYSGNGNNWTPNNISVTAGVTYDSMLDVPTQWADGGNGRGNYATWNPLVGTHSNTYSNGNLQVATSTANAAFSHQRSTFGVSSGKWYWEITCQATSSAFYVIGITADTVNPDSQYVGQGNSFSYRSDTGQKANNGTFSAYGSTFTTGNIIGVEFDADAGTLVFYKNNVSQGTAFTGISGTYFPAVSDLDNNTGRNSTFIANFGQRPFAYTPPTGFKALNTLNLPEPTILKGNQYFDINLWTGNGTSQTIVNSGGFAPDLVWFKSRSSGALWNVLCDTVRGATKELYSNATNAETTDVTDLTSFNSNGFSVGSGNGANQNAGTYVGWQWKEGATQGFDIVTYTGTGVARTVAHSLGVAPSMMIVKRRNTTSDWIVWHSAFAGTEYIALNSTAAKATGATIWNSTSPTSSVFSVGTSGATNGNTDTYVAYLFAEVAGFSKFGAYTGNGSSDGPFVFCGFRPRYVMLKASSTTEIWIVYDSSRNTYNVADLYLYPNSSAAEAGSGTPRIDFLSNGFKLRNTGQGNVSAVTYIFAAFAESPFKNALAR